MRIVAAQDVPGAGRHANATYGTLRYGSLLEAVLYDCRRYLDSKGTHARVLPRWVEDWVVARTRAEDTVHFMHVPSLPFGYSAGKLGDWYPDLLDNATGKLVLGRDKPGWQPGWFTQHQRLIEALGSQTRRAPVADVSPVYHLHACLSPCLDVPLPGQVSRMCRVDPREHSCGQGSVWEPPGGVLELFKAWGLQEDDPGHRRPSLPLPCRGWQAVRTRRMLTGP